MTTVLRYRCKKSKSSLILRKLSKMAPSDSEMDIDVPIVTEETFPDRIRTVPRLLYGTAFKGDRTNSIVAYALEAGFRGIDSAAMTRAYQERFAGESIRNAVHKGVIKREDIWVFLCINACKCKTYLHSQIQSKFTPYLPTKDPAFFPYDVTGDIKSQVDGSIASSLNNFTISSISNEAPSQSTRTSKPYLDAILLHSPLPTLTQTLEAYRALESHVPQHVTRLGLSNIGLDTLRAVYDAARIKPSIVQNRFTTDIASIPNPKIPPGIDTPEDRYDAGVRAFCEERGIVWQPWGVLWGSPGLLVQSLVGEVAENLGVVNEVALYACVQELPGQVTILAGTGKEERVNGVIDGMRKVEDWKRRGQNSEKWKMWMMKFREILLESN